MIRIGNTPTNIGFCAFACTLVLAVLTVPSHAAPSKKRVWADHLHTGEAKGYEGGSALLAKAKQDWVADVSQHDGPSWANLSNASIKGVDCDKTLVKGKGWLFQCSFTARPSRWEKLNFPAVKNPPLGRSQ